MRASTLTVLVCVALLAAANAQERSTYVQPRAPDGQPDISGFWHIEPPGTYSLEDMSLQPLGAGDFHVKGPAGSRIIDPPDGRIPYQAWARARAKDVLDNHLDPKPHQLDPQSRCFLGGVPRVTYQEVTGMQIDQVPGHVILTYEFNHAYRIIPLDRRPHVGGAIKLWMGDGRGRWEGITLVVDTTNLKAKSRLDVVGDFFSDNARIVERFIFDGADTMTYEATITDPMVFTRPWTIRVAQRRLADDEFWEWACHEGERDAVNTSTSGSPTGRD